MLNVRARPGSLLSGVESTVCRKSAGVALDVGARPGSLKVCRKSAGVALDVGARPGSLMGGVESM